MITRTMVVAGGLLASTLTPSLEAIGAVTHVRRPARVARSTPSAGQTAAGMTAVDRKIVHDTVNTLPGLATVSEGEEPRRQVVIVPESSVPEEPEDS